MKVKFLKDKEYFKGTPPKLQQMKAGDEAEVEEYFASAFIDQEICVALDESEEVANDTKQEQVAQEKSEETTTQENESEEAEEVEIPEKIQGYMNIYNVEPEKLDISELKELAKFYGIKLKGRQSEKGLIEKIKNVKGE